MRKLTDKETDAWEDYIYRMGEKAYEYEKKKDYAKMLNTIYALYSHPYNDDRDPIVDKVFKNPRMIRWMIDYRKYLHEVWLGNEGSWVQNWDMRGPRMAKEIAYFVGEADSDLIPHLIEERDEYESEEQDRLLKRLLEIQASMKGPASRRSAVRKTAAKKTIGKTVKKPIKKPVRTTTKRRQ